MTYDVHWTWRSDEAEAGLETAVERWLDREGAWSGAGAAAHGILEENRRLRSVLGHCPKGIAVLDERGTLVGFNRELVALLGVTPELGKPISSFFEPTDREMLDEVVRCAGTERRTAAVLRKTANDEPREIEFFAATLPGKDETSIGVVLAGEDRTAAMGDDSERAFVDEANKDAAFRLASAMLCNELGQTLAEAERALLDARTPRETVVEMLRQARAVCERRTALPPPPPQSSETASVSEAAARAARFSLVGAVRRKAFVHVDVPTTLHARLAPRHLTQILTNVVRNAVHAVSAKNVLGVIDVRASSEAADRVSVRIRDNGVGIEPSRLNACFEPYETSHEGAKGLGLPIAKLLVESAGGTIRLVSAVGEGTEVVIDLPRAHLAHPDHN